MKLDSPGGRRVCPLLLALAVLTLGGCQRDAPTGQVVARIGGTDITHRDLAVEVAAAGRAAPSDAELRGPVLAGLVGRKLLVQRAHREGLDLTPEYIAAVRRDRDMILAGLAVQRIAAATPPPTADEVRAYVRGHGTAFGGRMLFLVRGGGDRRPSRWIDGARLSDDDARRLAATPIGGNVTVALAAVTPPLTMVARRIAPVPAGESWRQARELLRRDRVEAGIAAVLDRERASTRVQYQQGFGPGVR